MSISIPKEKFYFTSESVTEGHPDKVADQISDAILDAIMAEDKRCRVAAETLVTTGMAFIAGEITTSTYVEMPQIVRDTIRDIGYNSSKMGFDWQTCAVMTSIDHQSPDIAQGVDKGDGLYKEQGAGDQGLMFGYASDETPELMPMPIILAHQLCRRLAEVRKNGQLDFLRPDGKSQVTVEYEDGAPKRVDAVVIATQHKPDVESDVLREGVIDEVVRKVIPAEHAGRRHALLHQPHRPFRDRRADGRLRADRSQDHRRHLRRAGQPRRRLLLGQGPLQGRPQRLLHGALHRQEHRGRRAGPALRGPDRLLHRRRGAGLDHGGHDGAPGSCRAAASPTSCGSASTCARPRSSSTWTCCGRSTARPPPTATSAAPSRSSPGRTPTWPPRCANWPASDSDAGASPHYRTRRTDLR